MTEREISIIDKAKAGSDDAFSRFYALYLGNAQATIRGFFKQPSIVDELVSTTFIKAFKKLHTFKSNDSMKSWISTIAYNSCIDYKRKHDRLRAESADDEVQLLQIISPEPNADERIAKAEEVRSLRRCMKLLPKKQETMLNMFYFEGKLYREIAAELGLPLGTVQSDLNRAKHKLRKHLLTV